MNILFLQSLTYPFIGIMSLSAVLRRGGHRSKMQFLNFNRPTEKDFHRIREFAPGLIGIPVYTGWQSTILKFCRQLKEKTGIPIVVGGPHPTHCPEILLDPVIDYLCMGEGEVSFLELANRLAQGQSAEDIPGIWVKKNGIVVDNGLSPLPHLPDLPPMDIDLYCRANEAIRLQNNRQFSLNRGCPFHCTYCNAPLLRSLYGKMAVRSKTVEQAMEEIHYVYSRYPFKSAYFTSDNLFLNKDFAYQFLPRFKKEIGVPFSCQMRVELIDAKVARILRESGCNMVGVGIESGSPRVRREILGRSMSNQALIRGCRHLQEQGIKINAYNMLGIPGETFSEAMETLALNIDIKPTTSWTSFFQPYPGTKLTRTLLEKGVITPEIFDRIPSSYFEKSVILKGNVGIWMNLQRIFQILVFFPSLAKLAGMLCRARIPRIYDPFFVTSYYFYLVLAYNEGWLETLKKVLRNAFEVSRASAK
jgi:anaerobic magnesium-protoporphyrin IX monomethyl ester cyclase